MTQEILKFVPFSSFVNPTFWHKLTEIKLDYDRLSDAPRTIYGYYTNRAAKSCFMELEYSAFNSNFKEPKFCHKSYGTLYNKNTIEEFKNCDKNLYLVEEGLKFIEDIKSERVLDDVNLLARFYVLSFADLKSHNYYYWFAFPCPLTPTLKLQTEARKLQDIPELQHFSAIFSRIPEEQQNFFVLKASEKENFFTLKQIVKEENLESSDVSNYYFCFADASEYPEPSWLLRLYSIFIFYKCPALIGKTVNFLALRYDHKLNSGNSLVWQVVQTEQINFDNVAAVQFLGWEPNNKGKLIPRVVSMKEHMDPSILAENSINLNLKLMKWRLVPDLNLEIMAKTKCLLFGAGTLGCAVARNLLAWGFRHITLIDNGNVGLSNPVRQSLYIHQDAVSGKEKKVLCAAMRICEINPTATAAGYFMQIPMPGHTVGESLREKTTEDVQKITDLVKEHDVIFLLTDSRESRWLPTLLGAAFNKIVINAALGFDSYLVMRHGISDPKSVHDGCGDFAQSSKVDDLICIDGAELGCYFCNDVTAPGNSLKDRTLDQQCTVTRPGVSNIAAAYAVELLVSLLQHPQRINAPAYYSNRGKSDAKIPEGMLGIIPHSIRGLLCNFENILPATKKFTQCIACSEKIMSEYHEHGIDFLFKAFETAKFLEDITGISDYNDLKNEVIDFDDLEISDG